MADPERVRQAMRELGRSLAAFRRAAGMNQFALAAAVHYTRSTVANVEVGRQNAPLDFWIQCDNALDAGGALRRGYGALCLIRAAHNRDEARVVRPPAAPVVTDDKRVGAAGLTGTPMIVSGPLADRLAQLLATDMIASGTGRASLPAAQDWDADTPVALNDLGRIDVDVERRQMLGAAAYSVAALALPGEPW